MDFQIPCFRPETPDLYSGSQLTKHEGRERNLERSPRLKDENDELTKTLKQLKQFSKQ